MAKGNSKKRTTRSKSKSKFKLELGFTKTLSLGAFIILAMVWSFILGVFIGRGYNPEDVIPEIARVMPDSSQRSVERILTPEELEFLEQLRAGDAPQAAPIIDRTPARTPDRTTPETPVQPAPEPRPEPRPAPAAEPQPAVETFIYTYQVGSFQTIERASELQQSLMRDGFTASITDAFVGNEPWYRVLVEFETSSANADQMVERIQSHGISNPLLRGKRPS
ncbi:SPOR domain-containing protein [Desulfonatronovibrio magnus]|uniref:SPOR domain-containing protein n=1 Tax=Desulfonatronovibrio magnus TaxID=698827 RepID=UPI0005EAD861|nr:SPOR domain-containing protein [Desulfonatronovibrio magnus]